ncbi:MAG: zinc-dependent metalloprotease [Cyclobacteriaceae bacterium]
MNCLINTSKFLIFLFAFTLSIALKAQSTFNITNVAEKSEASSLIDTELNRLRLQKSVSALNVISVENLNALLTSDRIDLSFIIDGEMAEFVDLDYKSPDHFTWKGKTKNGLVLLTAYHNELHGQIRNKDDVHDIQPLKDGQSVVITYNMPYLKVADCRVDESFGHNEIHEFNPNIDKSARASRFVNEIDVLVLYSPAAAATGLNPTTITLNAIEQWRNTSDNSNVYTEFNLVGVESFPSFTESPSIQQDARTLAETPDAQARRDATEADIVIMLVDGENGDYVRFAGVVADIGPNNNQAYALAKIGNASSTITFVHEAGHLMGGRHQIQADPTSGDQHGHGWKTGLLFWTKRYGSIMNTRFTTTGLEVERTMHFSNPAVENRNRSTGVAGEINNARVFNDNGQIVCAFRGDTNPLTAAIDGPITVSSGETKTFNAQVNGGTASFSYVWVVTSSTGTNLPRGYSASYTVTIPSNANLTLDLTVFDSEGRSSRANTFVRNIDTGGGQDPTIFVDENASLEEEIVSEILLFPNPTENTLQIALPERYSQVRLLDMTGRVLRLQNTDLLEKVTGIKGHLLTWDLTQFTPGIYVIEVGNSNQTQTFKVIKK